jgi:hypothetical protein
VDVGSIGDTPAFGRRCLRSQLTLGGPPFPADAHEWLRLCALLPVIFLAALSRPLAGQDGTLQGRVRDDEGAAVYRATVTLLRRQTPVASVDTDRLGLFRFQEVAPGPYTVRVQGLGYFDYSEETAVGLEETVELDLRIPRSAIEIEGISVDAERSRARARFEEVGGATVRELALVEIRAVPGLAEPDPVRALEVLPGVVSTSDFSSSFHVRGGSQDQNLILLDGMPIFSPFHLGGIFSVFNADMVDRVELHSGGFPAEHGGRVSSVLQIESNAGAGNFSVDAAVSLLATRVAVGGGVPSSVANALGFANIRYKTSGRRSYIDLFFPKVPYHLTDFQTIVEGWTTGGDRVTLTAYSGKDVFDLTNLDDEDFPLRVDWDWGNDAIGARWIHPRSGGGSFDVRANFSRFGTGLTFPDFADTRLSSRIQQGQFRADLDMRPLSRLSVQVGASAEIQSYKNRFSTGGTEFAGGAGDASQVGTYVQTRWTVPSAWLVELGLRADGQRPDPGNWASAVAPRLAVKRFLGGGDLAVKMAGGRYAQFVHSMRDEELPLGLDFWVLAGERAPHTVSNQAQVGIEAYHGTDWFWSAEAYVRTFDGVVTFNTADNPNDELDDILQGNGLSYGIDFLIKRERGAVTGWLAASFLKADRTFPDPLSAQLERPDISYAPIFDRRVDLDFVLRYPAPWGWEGGLRWNLGTGTPYTRAIGSFRYYDPTYVASGGLEWLGTSDAPQDEDPDLSGNYGVVLEERGSSRYPAYHRLDASFRKTFDKSWGFLTPYVNLVNVYNRKNVLFYFFEYEKSPPTRSGVSMFPVLPTFGLEARF